MTRQINWIQRTISGSAIALLPTSAIVVGLGTSPAIANAFDGCIQSLQLRGASEQTAANACSDALKPRDLAGCVRDITKRTPIAVETAINACYRVRRPLDLADCVVDINKHHGIQSTSTPAAATSREIDSTSETPALVSDVLDACRRSLLPQRLADCVLAINRQVPQFELSQSLATCLSAQSSLRDDVSNNNDF